MVTKQDKQEKQESVAPANVSKDEQVGFHKGALATLAKEREEMVKIISIVEQLMQMHIKALKDLGIDLEAQAREMAKKQQGTEKKPASASGKLDQLL
ncbi:hypothetical protein HYY69_06855 [Candidatus Woesearchaeota archaeon]|nr:hypothetical protein [Candidatus Woesearchaeota archaeon]